MFSPAHHNVLSLCASCISSQFHHRMDHTLVPLPDMNRRIPFPSFAITCLPQLPLFPHFLFSFAIESEQFCGHCIILTHSFLFSFLFYWNKIQLFSWIPLSLYQFLNASLPVRETAAADDEKGEKAKVRRRTRRKELRREWDRLMEERHQRIEYMVFHILASGGEKLLLLSVNAPASMRSIDWVCVQSFPCTTYSWCFWRSPCSLVSAHMLQIVSIHDLR